MSVPGDHGSGAAKRRRDHRLRMHARAAYAAGGLAAALHHSRDVGPVSYNALRSQRTARAGEWGREQNYTAETRDPPLPSRSSSASSRKSVVECGQGRSRTLRRRRGFAARGGTQDRGVPLRADPRCSCAAGWEPAGKNVPAPRFAHPRAGYRSAQDLFFTPSLSQAPGSRGADGGAVGGSAGIRVVCLSVPAADR